jgi:hypothetical protein
MDMTRIRDLSAARQHDEALRLVLTWVSEDPDDGSCSSKRHACSTSRVARPKQSRTIRRLCVVH